MNLSAHQPLTVLSADNVDGQDLNPIVITSKNKTINKTNKTIGFKVYEKIGIGVVNPRGITKASNNVVIGS